MASPEHPEADLGKIAKLLGVAGSSHHDGEAINAIRAAHRLLREAGMAWNDLVAPHRQLQVATEAAQVLLAENIALRDEIEHLRATGTAVSLRDGQDAQSAATWIDVGSAFNNARTAAQWALDLHTRGAVWLSTFEINFLTTCTKWTGRLTARQRPVFQRIMDRITEQTGKTPPA